MPVVQKASVALPKKGPPPPKPPSTGGSKFAAFRQKLAQQQKLLKQQGGEEEEGIKEGAGNPSLPAVNGDPVAAKDCSVSMGTPVKGVLLVTSPGVVETKTFDGGFFSVSSPVAPRGALTPRLSTTGTPGELFGARLQHYLYYY